MAWETANAKTLDKLVVVIKKVVEAAKNLQGPCIVSFDENDRSLKVSLTEEGKLPILPLELEELFGKPT